MDLYFDISDKVNDTVCDTSDDDTDYGVDHDIAGFFHFFIFSDREDHLDASPRDADHSENARDTDTVFYHPSNKTDTISRYVDCTIWLLYGTTYNFTSIRIQRTKKSEKCKKKSSHKESLVIIRYFHQG